MNHDVNKMVYIVIVFGRGPGKRRTKDFTIHKVYTQIKEAQAAVKVLRDASKMDQETKRDYVTMIPTRLV